MFVFRSSKYPDLYFLNISDNDASAHGWTAREHATTFLRPIEMPMGVTGNWININESQLDVFAKILVAFSATVLEVETEIDDDGDEYEMELVYTAKEIAEKAGMTADELEKQIYVARKHLAKQAEINRQEI